MKFTVKDLFSKCYQILRKLPIWSDLLKKSLTKNFISSAVEVHFAGILFLVSVVTFNIIPGGRNFVFFTVEIKPADKHATEIQLFQNLKILYKLQIKFIGFSIDLDKAHLQYFITRCSF